MTASIGAYEVEGMFEQEDEAELEGEAEVESEEFFRRLASLAQRAGRSPALRRVGLTAARSALSGLGGAAGAPGLGSALGTLLPQREIEGEEEGEEEGEWETSAQLRPEHPMRRIYPAAVMEHLGHAATETESEAEAEAFIGALVPLAARLLPRAASTIMRAAPQLIRGAARVTRTLRRNPTTRPLVRAVPTIVRRTAANIAQQIGRGQRVTPQGAVQTLARQTAQVLSSPQQCVRAYQRSRAADRHFHRAAGAAGRRPAVAG